jgi:undecaprenyl-diphosphatase
MLLGVEKSRAEMFSFALAVVLTPVVVVRELIRVVHAEHASGTAIAAVAFPNLLGAVFAFLAGLIALKWLSRWLEGERWYLFGIYCLIAALGVGSLHHLGY